MAISWLDVYKSTVYRESQREGADPTTAADVTAELLSASSLLRKRLLVLTLLGAMAGGVALTFLYLSLATTIYGRVLGLTFAVGALVTFVIAHKMSRTFARALEARWASGAARRHNLSAEDLKETLRMLD